MGRSGLAVAVVACAVVFVAALPFTYAGGYFALCDVFTTCPGEQIVRVYKIEWLAQAYRPLAKAESRLTSVPVFTAYDDGATTCVVGQP